MFDLNEAIVQWRGALKAQPNVQSSDLDELEDHLREEISNLSGSGLTEEEIFLVSSRRLGKPEDLNGEFAIADPTTRRNFRLRWMVTGALALIFLWLASDALTNFGAGALGSIPGTQFQPAHLHRDGLGRWSPQVAFPWSRGPIDLALDGHRPFFSTIEIVERRGRGYGIAHAGIFDPGHPHGFEDVSGQHRSSGEFYQPVPGERLDQYVPVVPAAGSSAGGFVATGSQLEFRIFQPIGKRARIGSGPFLCG